ncbi:Uma2 family endonuclease [Egbenema bharatensis]|uniref:Uma2 family endonuclease n=1 Tax=Egbenema bharatensis TaxID=3463334 RepID=UPI003A89018E
MSQSISQSTTDKVRWTAADLELFPENGNRYEIIEGELLVTRAPDWRHQKASTRISTALDTWSLSTGLGEAVQAPGLVFTAADNVIPDVVWVSRERLAALLDEAGHLTGAPELVVEVLSPGSENERRDRELKLKLYSERGVQEYWIIDWQRQQVEVYRRSQALLRLVNTLFSPDRLLSPLLPGFSYPVSQLFQ